MEKERSVKLEGIYSIGVLNEKFIYVDAGTIVALTLEDGVEIWKNSDFEGSGCYVVDEAGRIYMSGYYGPDFFEIQKILQKHKPKAIFMENVKQLVTHDKGNTFKVILGILADLGYHVKWKVLNALDFGVPQKRERVIIVGFLDKSKIEKFSFDFDRKPYSLKDVLQNDEDVDPSLFVSDRILQKRKESTRAKKVFYPSIWHENKAGNISVLDYACALRTGASYNYLLVNGYRRPSSRELLRLQGFPEKFRIVVSHQEIRKQTGNSVAVPMMTEVAKRIKALL